MKYKDLYETCFTVLCSLWPFFITASQSIFMMAVLPEARKNEIKQQNIGDSTNLY